MTDNLGSDVVVVVAAKDLEYDLAWTDEKRFLTKAQCEARDRMRQKLEEVQHLLHGEEKVSGRGGGSSSTREITGGGAAGEFKIGTSSNPVVVMLLWCPGCGKRHIDKGKLAIQPHHTHACQHCGLVWRPALVPTVGVEFLPGFKDEK